MREALTIFACLLIAVLTAALVGPHFIDWTAHRAEVERQLSAAAGAEVQVQGPIELVLLPIPSLKLEQVRVGAPGPGLPRLDVSRAAFEVSVAPLLRGEFRFTRVDLESPRLRLTLGADGGLALPQAALEKSKDVQFDRMSLRDGSLALDDPAHGRSFSLDRIALDMQGDSLIGPFKGNGSLRLPDGRAANLRFSTAALEGDRLRSKAVVDLASGPHLEFDGALVSAGAAAGTTRLSYEGAVVLSDTSALGGTAVPWRLTGALKADVDGASVEGIEARAGDDDRGLTASGRATLAWSPKPRGEILLNARQVDLDRLFADKADATAAPRRFAEAVGKVLAAAPAGRSVGSLTFKLTSPAIVLGGETLTDGRGELRLAPDALPGVDLELNGPGRTHLALSGAVETGSAAVFRGHVDAAARDLSRLKDWVALSLPDVASRLAALPFRSLEVAGDVDVAATGVSGRMLTLRADRSTLTGALAFTRAVGGERGRLYADLRSQALDLDGLPSLADPAAAAVDLDLALTMEARAVRVARFGEGMIDSGRIGLKLTKTGPDLRLERLEIENIGGAGVSATGSADGTKASIDARLVAARLGDLADLVRRVAPGAVAEAFAARSTALSPARLALHLEAQRTAGGTLALSGLTLGGTARGTAIDASIAPDALEPGDMTATMSLDAAEAPLLLRQIGIETLPLNGLGRGRISLNGRGRAGAAFETKMQANVAGAVGEFDGRVDLADGPKAQGSIRLSSADISPLLQVLAIALPDANGQRLPADLSGQITLQPGQARINDLAGAFVGSSTTGDLTVDLPTGRTRPHITGALRFDRLSLPALAALALGPAQPSRAGALWSDARFALGLADPPDLSIKLAGRSVLLLGGLTGEAGSLRLDVAPGVVTMNEIALRMGAGSLAGRLTLRRDKAAASLSGTLDLQDVILDRPSTSGKVGGHLEVTATGTSAANLAAGLAGRGTLRIADLAIPRAAPDSLSRMVAATDEETFAVDEPTLNSRISRDLDRGPLVLGTRTFDVGIASGMLRLAPSEPAAALTAGLEAQASASLDLRSLLLDERATIRMTAPPKDWKEPAPPQLTVVWRGPFATPLRDLEAGSLVNGLSARAIARESARIEAFESDLRERSFFVRRLKGLQYLQQREREIAAFEAEQARRAAEEERQRKAAEAAAKEAAARADAQARDREQKERDLNQAGTGGIALPIPAAPPPLPLAPLSLQAR